ncbi:hypothetical protein EV421DRAFT_1909768 [Armillaria borealis]|uniref:Extracellular membrane protein CFEM domain-containing protein n=1 Tax=Armillaria borealis TaxID=47425 RepID=A0AA39MGD7_9AGAR|nr:hypothetical protein EV421DRAFT_1909768 [Armillaria borealis]
MPLGFSDVVPFSLLCLIAVVWGQSSTTPTSTSITGSVTGTAISEPTSSISGSSTSRSTTSGISGSLSASSTLSAELPSLSGYSTCCVAEVNCFCGSADFSPDLTDCVTSQCPNELSTAETLRTEVLCFGFDKHIPVIQCHIHLFFEHQVHRHSSSSTTSTGLTTATGPSSTSTRTVSSTVNEPATSSASSNAALGRKVVAISGSAIWAIFAVVLGVLISSTTDIGSFIIPTGGTPAYIFVQTFRITLFLIIIGSTRLYHTRTHRHILFCMNAFIPYTITGQCIWNVVMLIMNARGNAKKFGSSPAHPSLSDISVIALGIYLRFRPLKTNILVQGVNKGYIHQLSPILIKSTRLLQRPTGSPITGERLGSFAFSVACSPALREVSSTLGRRPDKRLSKFRIPETYPKPESGDSGQA